MAFNFVITPKHIILMYLENNFDVRTNFLKFYYIKLLYSFIHCLRVRYYQEKLTYLL